MVFFCNASLPIWFMKTVWKKSTQFTAFLYICFFLVGKILPWKRHSIGFVAMDMVSIVHRCRHLKLNLFTVQKNDMCKPTKICIHQNRKVPFPQKMLKICVNLIYFHFKKKDICSKSEIDQTWSNLIKFDQNHGFHQVWSNLVKFDQIWSMFI